MSPANDRSEPAFTFVVRSDAETLDGLRKQAVLTSGGAEFTIYCDEAAPGGKPSTAPSPMAYFAASILF